MQNALFYIRRAGRSITPAFWSGYLLVCLLEEALRNKYIPVEEYTSIDLGIRLLAVFKLLRPEDPVTALLGATLHSVSPILHQGLKKEFPRFVAGFMISNFLVSTAIASSVEHKRIGKTPPITLLVAGVCIYTFAKTVRWFTKSDIQNNKPQPPLSYDAESGTPSVSL